MAHDHDHDGDEDCCEAAEIEIAFEVIPETLERHGLNADELGDALMAAIDQREEAAERGEELAAIEEMPLSVRGTTYRCGDVYEVTVTEHLVEEGDELDDDDLDDGDEEAFDDDEEE